MAVSLDLGSAMVVAGAGQQSFLELSSWLTENDSSETDERAPWNTTSTVSQTTPGSSNNEDPSFNCEYRWYNLCPTHTGPYPQASDGSSEEFVLRLDQMQSFWMQAGWLLMSFVGAGCFCFLLRCFVLARARFVKGHSQLKDFGYYTPERERYLEYFLGVLTMICFAIFADETCELGEGHRFFEEVHPFDRWVEVLAASMMFFCFCLRLYYSDLHGPCPCLMNFLTSPLMYFDLLAMAPTLTELILQESGIFPNLVWLRFPRLLDTALKDGSGGEGIGVIAKLVSANWSILKIPAHLLCAVWFACSSIHYLTECENEEFVWGVEPGYHRYISIPSAMYYALIDFNGEFPNADEFSAPFGRMNSMVICLLGTYLLSIPAGVLGAAFHDHVTRNHGRLDAVGRMQALEARPPPSKSFSVMLIGFVVLSTGNFILLTVVYQRPVCENDVEGHLFEEGSWQRATIAPCRYLDCLLAIPFFTIWAAKLVTIERARDYILSASHAVDLAAWLPSYFLLQSLVLHGSCLEHTGSDRQASLAKTQLAFHGMCMFRWLKLDCVFGRMFKQLQFTLAENKVIFRMSLICAATLWLLGSVLMYYAERDNPDEGTRDHFKTLPLSFWMTALDFTSEAPINDHGAQGKAVHTIIMLLGVGLFTVPMGLFASAFRERLDEMHAKTLRRPD
ncbi:unnamed protein product [Durusdinium trenchii]|uniref:Uncharacterized protein n=1 Tax=Durusdinium trenchii TaxID=1381693 RepID=A0ABP0R3Q6_9DINO